MDIINICVMTKDVEYGLALVKTLQHESKFFSVSMMDMDGPGGRDISEYDLVLLDEGALLQSDHKTVVRLSEKRSSAATDGKNEGHVIFKYQSIENIAKEIKRIYSTSFGRSVVLHNGGKPNVTAVFGSSGGVGCTSVTLGLCQELQRFHGRNVLYLTLEEFESTCFYFKRIDDGSNAGIQQFLYQLLYKVDGKASIEEFLMKDEYGVSAFLPSGSRNPIMDLNGGELILFVEHLLKKACFDDIFVDCGNNAGLAQLNHLRLADHHVYVGRQDENPLRKRDFVNWFQKILGDIPHPDPVFVTNFYNDDEEEGDDSDNIKDTTSEDPRSVEIYEDRDSFSFFGTQLKIELDKNFGVGIRDLADRIMAF